ncbi:PDZ and LIM domain protein 7-like isoform X2 [Anneissia japonica]|uniref:PDZ and LIM domain protein 7-like isoform X2 n=1 Tax=Anneissia japonica TaxID=1529436 RepID=UPI0014258DA9|nr:PDZ and LIM domain protein 7-like isoform X2 [Anneissia japonica]
MDRALQVTIQGPGPWGFRLAGGKDFNTPLQISKVTPGGKAAKQNLYPNDIVTAIDGQDTSSMTHLEAQNKIKAASGNLMLNIQRTGEARVWKPTTTRIEPQGVSDGPSFKVSLAANKQESQNIGSKHNVTARPFGAGDAVSPGTATVVHKQFNSPAGLYSASNIAETFKGQTEGLIAGHMLEGEEEPQAVSNPGAQSRSFKMLQQHIGDEVDGPSGMTNGAKPAGMKSVKAPTTNPNAGSKPASSGQLPICFRCQIGIVGPFVNLKGKSLHPDCFVCEACNCSLRNKGYFTVAGKMYCEQDAKAKQIEQQQQKQSPAPAQVAPKSVSNGQGSMKINLSSAAKPAPPVQSYSPQQPQTFSQKPPSFRSPPPPVKPKPQASSNPAPDPNLVIAQALNQNPEAMKSVCGIKPVFTVQSKVSHQIPWEKEGPSSPRIDYDDLPPPPSPTEFQPYDASSEQNDFPAPPPPPPPPPGPEFTINVARPMGLEMKRSPPPDVPVYKAPGKKSTPSQIAQQSRMAKNAQPKAFSPSPQAYTPSPQAYTPPRQANPPQAPGDPVLPTVPVFRPSQPKAPSGPAAPAPFSTVPRPANPGVPKATPAGTRTPTCEGCGQIIRGPFVSAVGKNWHPEHFVCAHCHEPLQNIGFVEEKGKIYCEKDYTNLYAPKCSKCMKSVAGKCVNALGGQFHPECFVCFHCNQPISGNSFHTNEGKVYCTADYNALFSTTCASCMFAIEPGDEWLEALGTSWHSNCFNCNACQVNLEGHGFYAKNGKPYCPQHA